jgi:copper chaperone NosL
MKNISIFIFVLFLMESCSIEPIPIQYGKDECELCRMKIIETGFGAELLTKKGKAYKFDSIECMVTYIKNGTIDNTKVKQLLVIDHAAEGVLVDARSAFFLHSTQLQSPMGAGLSSFGSLESLKMIQKEYSGDILSWDQLLLTDL